MFSTKFTLFCFVLLAIVGNIAAETCRECKKTAKTNYKTARKQCKTDYKAGTNGVDSKQLFISCKFQASSDRYSELADCYEYDYPCNPTDAPTAAPTAAPTSS